MKKLLFFAFAAFAMAACSDDIDAPATGPQFDLCPATHTKTISFEGSEGLKDIEGVAVKVGDVEVVGGSAAGKFSNVYWAKSISNFDTYLVDNSYGGPLFGSADENIWINTYFSTSSYGDYWGGFVLTGNFGKQADSKNYNQFTVWADKGANGSSNCLIGYYDNYTGGYAMPAIEFATEPLAVCHCYMANTAIAYNYAPGIVAAEQYYYKVAVIGWLKNQEIGRVECTLIEGGKRVADWVRVDLTMLGKVDKLTFVPESNEKNDAGLMAPAYFALDELGFVAGK